MFRPLFGYYIILDALREKTILLFLIFINDIHGNIDSQMRLFADDCLVYRITNSPNDCLKLQDLSLLCDWESEWQMEFNKSKQETIKGTERASPLYTLFHR